MKSQVKLVILNLWRYMTAIFILHIEPLTSPAKICSAGEYFPKISEHLPHLVFHNAL
jgi:hypothetical protein